MALEPTRDNSGKFAKDLSNQARLLKEIEATQSKINALRDTLIDGDKEQEKLIKSQIAYLNKLNKINKQNTAEIKKQTENFEDMDDAMVSIGNQLKNNNKLVEITRDKFEATHDISKAITKELATGGAATNKSKQQVISALGAYKQSQISISEANKQQALGVISERERLQIISNANDAFQTQLSLVDRTQIASKELLGVLDGMGKEAEDFANGIQKAQLNTEAMDRVFDNFSGIPAMGELNALLKTNIKDTLAFKAAVFALGAALGKAAMDYFGAPIKTAMEQYKQTEQNRIDTEANIGKLAVDAQSIPRQIEQERLEARVNAEGEIQRLQHEAAFAGAKAALQFSAEMQSGAAAFERASKTALFGNKLGSVGYGAAQLQLAGISADQIAGGMEAAAAATGKMPSGRVGADMAMMAERTGASVDNIASINEMFQRIDGVTESTAMNLSEGLRNMADQANIGLGGLMREIADASKDALSYQIKSGPALAKQVAYAQSLGLSFGDIAKAGKSMVMNYKDSIKNEMQLSAMLGKNVDLSEVRAKFASGDTDGALKSLQAQGLDPAQMDMFAQEQLSQALGGMDLNSLQKISKNQGAQVGGLKAGSAGAANQDFLSRTQSAESALNSQQASISANTAILDAKLSQTIADSYLESPEYASLKTKQNLAAQEAEKLAGEMNNAWINSKAFADQMTKTTKLNFVTGLLENVVTGLVMVLSGGLATKLFSGGGGGGLMSMFGKGGAGAAAPATAMAGGGGAMPAAGGMGGGAAGGFGGVLKGIAEGLKGFASPQVLVGLAAITIALKVLEPVIASLVPVMVKIADVVGNVLVKALEMAGPIITSIFNGIGTVISSIGTSISTIIGSLATSVGQFALLDAGNLGLVAGAVTALSVAVGLFGGASILGAIGSFFGGGVFDDLKDISTYANPIQITANAVQSLANAFASLSSIDTSALTKIPWDDMEDFASEGGKFVLASSGGGSFALSKETTDNIKKMATNTEAMVKLNNTMAKLLKEGFFGGETTGQMKLYIDGKDVSTSMKRYKSNTEFQDPKKG